MHVHVRPGKVSQIWHGIGGLHTQPMPDPPLPPPLLLLLLLLLLLSVP
jgi:hypothetical protein